MTKPRLCFVILFFATLLMLGANAQQSPYVEYLPIFIGGNPVENPGFNFPEWHDALWWDQAGGPYAVPFQEVRPPTGWTAFWREGDDCDGQLSGRPEVNVFEAYIDPLRVRSGGTSARLFTFFRCHRMGLMQTVTGLDSGYYEFSAWVQAWYSQCSTQPYAPPLEADCVTPIGWAHMRVKVGIDPYGGEDPWFPTVRWSDWAEPYGEYMELRTAPALVHLDGRATVFIYSESTHALKHEDLYVDDAGLARVKSPTLWEK